ncbi:MULTISPECIES: flavin reductase family protein [Thermomonosporaceae]|uniref:flavin reductase family protein n=1 Tax=Thermomonosporaceae TaxID=2012 RepID=UPI00255AA2C4|nr:MULTISPECIES: flavin reductase family protein [Thermomonosporaceae]MDL4777347.1 flavin reductase family protein [Actinomadura xylanilytica]
MTVQPQPAPEIADTRFLRRALGAFATGVTVVTIGGESPHAMTANAFSSVSLDPPLVLICVDHSAIMHRGLDTARCFGVSVLAEHQEGVARHFADRRRPLGTAQFEGVDCVPGRLTGVPMIGGALAGFECEVWRRHDAGDHTIFLGRLLSAERSEEDEGLLFFDGGFRRLVPEGSEVAS